MGIWFSLILSVSENGYGKRTDVDQYRLQSRGGKSVINMKATPKHQPRRRNHRTHGHLPVRQDRIYTKSLRTAGRNTQGQAPRPSNPRTKYRRRSHPQEVAKIQPEEGHMRCKMSERFGSRASRWASRELKDCSSPSSEGRPEFFYSIFSRVSLFVAFLPKYSFVFLLVHSFNLSTENYVAVSTTTGQGRASLTGTPTCGSFCRIQVQRVIQLGPAPSSGSARIRSRSIPQQFER